MENDLKAIRQQVIQILEENGILLPDTQGDIELEEAVEDSIAFMSAVLSIEEEMNIQVPSELISGNLFSSLHGLCKTIEALQEQVKAETVAV